MNKYTDNSPQIWCKHSRRAERKPRRGEATKSAAPPDPLGRGGNHNGSYADGAFCQSSHAKYSGIDTRRRPGYSLKASLFLVCFFCRAFWWFFFFLCFFV